ncbi:MAG: hypothetical protein AABY18_04305 [Candidatus Thermoplasmatota archaeon]
MRILTLALAALLLLSIAPSADAKPTVDNGVALCVADVYNNQQGPSSGCDGVACTGYSNEDWETCVGDCTTCVNGRATDANVALCVYGDAYNTGGSRCAGVVCVGWTMGHWVDCYPRLPPCWACPPPPPTTRLG